jgi:tetracenomycin F1 monooxygenase
MFAKIEAGADIFTLINTFQAKPGMQQRIIDELAEVTESLMRHLPGFVGSSAHRSLDGEYVVNYVQWRSKADFDAMFTNGRAIDHMKRVSALAVSVTPRFYTVAYVVAAGGLD